MAATVAGLLPEPARPAVAVKQAPPPPPAPVREKPAPIEAPKPIEALRPVEPIKPEVVAKPSKAVTPVKPPRDEVKPVAAGPLPAEPRVEVGPPAPAAETPRQLGAIPLLEAAAGTVALWRQHELCPGVSRCGLKTINPAPPVRYVTGTPYFGPAVRLALFPLAGWDSPLRAEWGWPGATRGGSSAPPSRRR